MSQTRNSARVLLVGFEDQDNLGLRYLMSTLAAGGHQVDLLEYSSNAQSLIAKVGAVKPDVVGFSLIFQYMAGDFAQVIEALRSSGYSGHVTMGGHYSSFDYGEVLRRMPGLDSVVRFEGEDTLLALAESLISGADWRRLNGLAFRDAEGLPVSNPLREPRADLDTLPWPDRRSIVYGGGPLTTASVLGSRGCPWKCSFCSIRPFYEMQGGSLRRLRRPDRIVDEIADLFENRHVRIFLFQDDDFLATGRRAREWAGALADEIIARGLAGQVAFKMSCRSDEVRPDIIERLVRGGLTHVYMGVESGDEAGLVAMDKLLTPEAHLRAGEILREFGLSFDFGFMLLDPDTDFGRIRANVDFLETFVGDGWSVSPFCRMLPYAGTPVKRRLEAEGRMRGTAFEPDYVFRDEKIDLFYGWMIRTFQRRNFTTEGLAHRFRVMLFESALKLGSGGLYGASGLRQIRYLAAVCNGIACYTIRQAVAHFEATSLDDLKHDTSYLDVLTGSEHQQEARLEQELLQIYQTMRRDPEADFRTSGGFDRTWTMPAISTVEAPAAVH